MKTNLEVNVPETNFGNIRSATESQQKNRQDKSPPQIRRINAI